MNRIRGRYVAIIPAAVGILIVVSLPATARAQATQPTTEQTDTLVKLDLPERLDVQAFVNYVSRILEINIFYDEKMSEGGAGRTITLKAQVQVPKSSLRGLLDSVLKMKGLALVAAEQPGWLKVVSTGKLLAVSKDGEKSGPGFVALTQIFALQYIPTARVSQIIKPFLTEPGGNSFEIAEQRLLIVTDYADNMSRIEKMIALVDKPAKSLAVEFVPIKNMEVSAMAQQLGVLLSAMQGSGRAGAAPGMEGARTQDVSVVADERSNQIVLIGPEDQVKAALKMVGEVDVGLGLQTQVYQFRTASPAQVDRLVKELIDPVVAKKFYRSSVDAEAGLLVVTSRPEVHEKIKAMQVELDRAPAESRNPLRFYTLYNTTAAEVLETIRMVEGTEPLAIESVEGLMESSPTRKEAFREDTVGTGPNRPPNALGDLPPAPPMYKEDKSKEKTAEAALAMAKGKSTAGRQGIQTKRARIVADVNTNSIVVVADPANQRLYEEMIKKLDRRRPQVLIECTIATVDTSNGFSLGVEIGKGGTGEHVDRWMTFSSFGINAVDPSTGRLSLKPGMGFNGALLSSDIADIIVHALETNGRSKVVSAPKILVNDNASGTLTSVSESPYTSVNASNVVATTSFAGYATAGTKIKVTPHISEGEHLQLEYSVELSTFSGEGAGGVPPPRQTASLDSKITIPDGYTVAIGGLNRKDASETASSLPGLGDVPWLKYLAGSRSESERNTTLFVFLRPVILRDDRFEDLKYLSAQEKRAAGLPNGLPVSSPLIVE